MKTSESIAELATALHGAQEMMTAAIKDSSNPFFKSSYADLGSVIKAIKVAFSDNGLAYTQCPEMNEHGVGVTTRIMHISGEWMESSLFLPMVKSDPQAAGSAITYARRYALQAIAGLPAADDDAEFAMDRTDYAAIDAPVAERIIELANEDEVDYFAIGEIWCECDKMQVERLWTAKTKGGYFTQNEKEIIRKGTQVYKSGEAA